MRPSNWLGLGLIAAALAIVPASPASACPNCKEAIASESDHGTAGNVSAGYSRSVLLMIGMPFALFGIGTVAVIRTARRGGIPQL